MDLLLSDIEQLIGRPLTNAQKEVLCIAAQEVDKREWSFAKTIAALEKTSDFDTPLPEEVRQRLLHPHGSPSPRAPQTPQPKSPPPEFKYVASPASPPPELPTQEQTMEDALARLYWLLKAELDFWEGKSTSMKAVTPRVIEKFMTAVLELKDYVKEKQITAFLYSFKDNVGPSKIRSCFRTNSAMKHFAKNSREDAERLLVRVCDKVLTVLRKQDRAKWDKVTPLPLDQAQEIVQTTKYALEQDVMKPEIDDASAMDLDGFE